MRKRGKVKTVVNGRGFGFIVPDEGGEEMFFHVTGMQDGSLFASLSEGSQVEYEEGVSRQNKVCATEVALVE